LPPAILSWAGPWFFPAARRAGAFESQAVRV
jgi:hypothetical protein